MKMLKRHFRNYIFALKLFFNSLAQYSSILDLSASLFPLFHSTSSSVSIHLALLPLSSLSIPRTLSSVSFLLP